MLDLLNKARELGVKKGNNYYCEEDTKKRFIGYASWRTGFISAKNVNSFDAAKPFFYMMQRSMPYANFEKFFVDIYNPRDKYRRPEWEKLVEECKKGQIDMIVMPTLQTLSSSKSDIIQIVQKLKELPKPVYVYFMMERLNSEEPSFELACDFLTTMYREQEEINRKKRKMSAYIKEVT